MAPAPISCRQYARLRGVSAMSVSNAIKTGRLRESVVRIDGQPKIADAALADQEWDRNTDAQRRANAAGGAETHTAASADDDAEGVSTATERLKSAQADLAELKFAEAAGELVPAAEVRREVAGLLSRVRTKLLGVPTQIKQSLPALSAADVLIVEDTIREALEETVADEIEPTA